LAIRFYIGGTASARDGTLISSGDLTAPSIFDGMYPAAGGRVSRSVPIMMRADVGELWKNVNVQLKGAYINKWNISGKIPMWYAVGPSFNTIGRICYFISVGDVNISLGTVTGYANGSESLGVSPDTTTQLIAYGRRVQ
jgi:hypothetical protein